MAAQSNNLKIGFNPVVVVNGLPWFRMQENIYQNIRFLPTWGSVLEPETLIETFQSKPVKLEGAFRVLDDLYVKSPWCDSWFDYHAIEVKKLLKNPPIDVGNLEYRIINTEQFIHEFIDTEDDEFFLEFDLEDSYINDSWNVLLYTLDNLAESNNRLESSAKFLVFEEDGVEIGVGCLVVPKGKQGNHVYWHFQSQFYGYDPQLASRMTMAAIQYTSESAIPFKNLDDVLFDMWNISDTPYDAWKKPFFTKEIKGWCWSRGFQSRFPWAHEPENTRV